MVICKFKVWPRFYLGTVKSWGLFYQHGLTLIPAWISNHMPNNYSSIPKLQWCNHWSLRMDKSFHPTLYNEWNHISMLGLKLICVSIIGPCFKIKPILNSYWTSHRIVKVTLTPLVLRPGRIQLLEADTKWPPFRRRHFQWHFLEWKYMNFD